jgi:hypothetical protein
MALVGVEDTIHFVVHGPDSEQWVVILDYGAPRFLLLTRNVTKMGFSAFGG